MSKKENKRAVVRVVLVWALALALVATTLPAAVFAGTTGDHGAYYADDTVPGAPDCARVEWNGMTWDVIGYNTGTVEHGVVGPPQTATLLLDAGSYSEADITYFDSSSPYSNEYGGSDLQAKVQSFYDSFTDKTGVEPNDLVGGSGFSISDGSGTSVESAPYTGGTVAGSMVHGQHLWPLSSTEASQLKASVREYSNTWWLRSPGYDSDNAAAVDNDGDAYLYGYNVNNYNFAVRPALYLNLNSPIFTSLINLINEGTLLIGAYDETLKVTDSVGYTWDIVGVNGDVSKGVLGPEGYATLLLSNSSGKKFGFPNQMGYAGTIRGKYDTHSEGDSNEYSSSDLKNALESAYGAISVVSEYAGKIHTRDLEGGESYNYDNPGEGVAGNAVLGQHLWPLSVSEARMLSNQERVFGYYWWLRSPGYIDNNAAYVNFNGYVDYFGYTVNLGNLAARPALYLNLDSSIFTSLPEGWQQRVASDYTGSPQPPQPQSNTVNFDPNGGAVSTAIKTVSHNTAIGEMPTPTRDGYLFAGWYTHARGGSRIDEATVITANSTYYAHWTQALETEDPPSQPQSDTVVFDPNGGAVSPASKDVEHGAAIGALPTPTREGYMFDGWYTHASGGSRIDEATVITANSTYYAHWTQIPPSGTIRGKVTDERGAAIANANVIIRKDRLQHSANTNAAGEYVFTGIATGVWTATVSASGSYFTETAQVTVDAERAATLDIILRGPRPLPVADGFLLSNGTRTVATNADGVPVVYWNQPITVSLENDKYANGRLSWQFILNGTLVAAGEDVPDDPAGTGHYSVTINPSTAWPTGQAKFIYSIKLRDSEIPVKGDFDLYYIDPSGVVVDKYGRPIEGAKVTLYRKDGSGAFTAVPDGSPIMEPSNRSNPSTTLSDGVFHWDVIDGTYKVTATFKGKSVSTPEMEISPARTELVLKLDVSAGKAPEPETYPTVTGSLKAGKTIKVFGVKWGDGVKQKSYDWYVDGKLQKGHKTELKLTKAMLKKKIVCYAVGERSVIGNYDGIEREDGNKQTHVFKLKAQVYPFTATFDANGGKEPSKAKMLRSGLTLGAKAGKLPKAVRPGYAFKGWRTGITGGAKVSAKTGIARTSTFYAQWRLKEDYVQAKFDVNGGTMLSPAKAAKAVRKSEKVGALPTPKGENREFLGWFSAKHGGKKITAAAKLSKSATFYAQWRMA